jgi:hypothetical protein
MNTLSGSSSQDDFWPDLLIPQASEINELYLSINQIVLNLPNKQPSGPEVGSNDVSHQTMESYETKGNGNAEGRLQRSHNSNTSLSFIKESKSSFESLEYKSVIYYFIYLFIYLFIFILPNIL